MGAVGGSQQWWDEMDAQYKEDNRLINNEQQLVQGASNIAESMRIGESVRQAKLRQAGDFYDYYHATQRPSVAAEEQATQATQEQGEKVNTNRTLELLRQQLMGQQRRGIGAMRGNLAQRGLMDSGSLGAGIGGINRNMSQLMAQGTMHAANKEQDRLTQMLEAQRDRSHQSQMQRMAFQQQSRMASRGQGVRGNSNFMDFFGGALGTAAGMLPFLNYNKGNK